MKAVMKATPAPGLELRRVPDPTPAEGEVVLRVLATSLCGTDSHIYRWDDWAKKRIRPPRILGHEMCGEIAAVGDGVSSLKVGDQVAAESHITYYAFDVLMHKGRDLTQVPLSERRALLRSVLKPSDHVALSEVSDRTAAEMLKFVKSHGLEGVVAKRSDSVYQPGLRTGLWTKHRINLGQEFVIGGYTPGTHGFDALIVGFYRGRELIYAARVRAGLVPATRRAVFEKIKHLKAAKCPFANLPELSDGRWGAGLTAEKMKECLWLKPEAVAQIAFLEWTGANHLRHTKFVALRDDKDPKRIVRET